MSRGLAVDQVSQDKSDITFIREASLADVCALLRELVTELRGLRSDVATSRQRPSRTALVPIIAATVQDRAFSSTELLRHADVDASLRAALAAAHITTARQLGKVLHTLEGRVFQGWRLERIGVERDGIVWRVFQV